MDNKLCCTCKQTLPVTAFAQRYDRKSQTYQSSCRACQKIYRRQHYLENHKYYILKSKKWRQYHRTIQYSKLDDYLISHPCVDCGETDPDVLDFDHVSNKFRNISDMIGIFHWDKIYQEIQKCEVRCANCHRKRTRVQLKHRIRGS